jgi:MarC family membrane protein
MTLLSASILLFLVMDPFGNIPVFLCVLKNLPDEKQQKIIIRELVIALMILILFLALGPHLLEALQISEPSLRIAGGIILFLIAIKMIFGATEELFRDTSGGEPLIVPLAIPSIAGPAAIATVMLLTGQDPNRWPEWLIALLLAWLVTSIILLLSTRLDRILGQRGLTALEHLMGLILTAIAVEMFLQGILEVFTV